MSVDVDQQTTPSASGAQPAPSSWDGGAAWAEALAAPIDKAGARIGTVLAGRYRLTGILGRGGYGVVYAGEHTLTGQAVAVKMLRSDNGGGAAVAQRFLREAQITANLTDPHTVRVYDVGLAEDQSLFIAMERLKGPTLEELLGDSEHSGHALEARAAVELGIAVLHSLGEAHAQGVVHRDLKPANIVLSEVNGQAVVKVLDFGIARQRGSALTDAGRSVGTPAYMSPEQCRAQPIDGRSDLYALGVILFRCLAGRLPFPDGDAMVTMFCQTHEAPPDLASCAVRPIPAALAACVMKALAKAPDERYPSAAAMREALEALRSTPGLSDEGPALAALPRRPRSVGEVGETEPVAAVAASSPRASAWPLVAGGAAVAAVRLRSTVAGQRRVVGRDDELAWLDAALGEIALARPAGPLLIEAEAGLGKSALVDELARRAQQRGVTVLVAEGDAVECATAYHAWRKPFSRLLGLEGVGDAQQRRALAADAVARLVGGEGLAPLLEAVLPLGLEDTPQSAPLSGQVRADRTVALMLALLARELVKGPLLLLLEDLHWFDSASLRLALQARGGLAGTLIVATTRPLEPAQRPGVDALLDWPSAAHRQLTPLDPAACRQLVADRLGVDEVADEVARLIYTRAQGNPLFAESLTLALCESGALRLDAAGWGLNPEVAPLAEAALADSVRGVIGSRIGQLPSAERSMLQAASAVGRTFPLGLLREIQPSAATGQPQEAQLADLVRQGLMAGITSETASTMAFRHTIMQEVAYSLMPAEQRRDLHRAVAAWYQRSFAGDLGPYYPLLAHHYGRAGDEAEELAMLQLGAQQALRAGAWREAIGLLQQCLAPRMERVALPGDDEPRWLRQARWLRQLSDAYVAVGDVERCGEHARLALARLGQPVRAGGAALLGHIAGQLLRQLWRGLRPGRAAALRGSAQAAALEAARCWHRLGTFHFFTNQATEMVAAVLASANAAARAGPSADLATAEASLAVMLGMVPLHALARRRGDVALATAERAGDPATTAWVRTLRGLYRIGTADWQGCRQELDAAQQLCNSIGEFNTWADAQALRTWTHHYRGEFDGVADCSAALLDRARRDGNPQHLAWVGRFEAVRLAALGDVFAAAARFAPTLVQLRAGRDRAEHLSACGSAAACAWQCGRREEAAALAYEALALVEAMQRSTSHVVVEGLAGMTEVLCALWQHAPEGPDRQRARKAALTGLAALDQSRRLFALAEPAWLRLRAEVEACQGKHAQALRSRAAALAAAQRLGMALEEARLRAGAAGLARA